MSTRPTPDRAAWLLHDAAWVGRETIQTSQYVELQQEARALKEELKKLQADAGELT